MKRLIFRLTCLAALCFNAALEAQDMTALADAREIGRKLLKTSAEYAVEPGEFVLLYPEWIPGIHGPRGPLQNLAEIRMFDGDGERLSWRRDPKNAYRFVAEIPEDARRLRVELTYICHQPSVNSRGVDSYGASLLGAINWNTCFLYPEGKPVREIQTDLKLILPSGWDFGTSLPIESQEENTVRFQTVSFHELVDSPVIMGEYFRTLDLTPEGGTPHFLHLAAEAERELRPEERTVRHLQRLVEEGMALFGRAPFEEYHFLLVLSDAVPRTGLEHLKSSFNSVGNDGLIDPEAIKGTGALLAHEYAHSWCGKYRRPAGMATPDYSTPKDTRLLWVYEGLDMLLGEMLAARCGILAAEKEDPFQEALERLAKWTARHKAQKGRRSVDLQDTASSAYLRRGGSEHWRYLNRSQDYYIEGLMLWIHVDAILRRETDGEKSLDDFIRAFLSAELVDPEKARTLLEFEEAEIYRRLNELAAYDWRGLIARYVKDWQEELPLEFWSAAGYRVQYSNEETDYDDDLIFTSLGLSVDEKGKVNAVVPGGAADAAGLYDGVEIIGVGDKKFSLNRLKDAVADSVAARVIKLLTLQGERFETIEMPYDQGPRFLDVVRDDKKPDRLRELFRPLVPVE